MERRLAAPSQAIEARFENSAGAWRERSRFLMAISGVILVSCFLRIGSATPDVSWLIDMCARILNGEQGYIDIFETTPPVPVLLYMPGAWLEKYVGIPAELAVTGYTYGTYLSALWLAWRILPRKLDGLGSSHWHAIFPLAVFLFILSYESFSQREMFAAALLAPMVCVLIAWRQTGQWPELKLHTTAIILASLGAAIKPPLFTLPLLLCGGYLLVTTRSLRPIYSSGLVATGFLFLFITAASLWAFPAYLDGVYQLMRDVYVPIRHDFYYGLFSDNIILAVACLALIRLRPANAVQFSETDKLFITTMTGFAIAYFFQGKYFDYHAVPIALFAFVIAWSSLLQNLPEEKGAAALTSLAPGKVNWRFYFMAASIAVISAGFFNSFDDDEPKLKDRSWAESLDHPTAMAISSGYITGFPLAREIDAQWINRTHCQWAVTYPEAVMRKQHVSEKQRRIFKKYQEEEINRVAALVPQKKPEIIIQSTTRQSIWLASLILEKNPTLFDDYDIVAEEDVFRIWRRKGDAYKADSVTSFEAGEQ